MKLSRFDFSIFKLQPLVAVCCGILYMTAADAAQVVQRGTATKPAATRANTSATRMPTLQTKTAAAAVTAQTAEKVAEPEPEVIEEEIIEEEVVVIENKSSQFDKVLNTTGTTTTDMAADARAQAIRNQRAALDSAAATATASQKMESALSGLNNACNIGLRDCMKQTCGNDFLKCAGDGDTIWGDKMDRCRRSTNCTGEEYSMFTREIKADRDFNQKLASYNETLECGNRYNTCIVEKCGVSFNKCLGKAAGDRAIADCASIAKNCQTIDSGLANRSMQVFATLRQGAEVQAKKDEERLYELRNLMAQQCSRLGAMFDERSLDCVFTVNFFANNATTPFASKKLYAGDSFDCNQEWFGIDVTTYRENAYRLTREQTSASSALLGSGLGIAAGSIASGAIDRAVDRASADKAVKKAEKEHKENFGTEVAEKEVSAKSSSSDKKSGNLLDKVTSTVKGAADGAAGVQPTGSQNSTTPGSDTGIVKPNASEKQQLNQAVIAAENAYLFGNCQSGSDSESCKNLKQKIDTAKALIE